MKLSENEALLGPLLEKVEIKTLFQFIDVPSVSAKTQAGNTLRQKDRMILNFMCQFSTRRLW